MTRKFEDYFPPVREDGLVTDKSVVVGGALSVTGATTFTGGVGAVTSTGTVTARSATATPATAGAVAAGAPITMFSDGPSIYVTSDSPTFSAVKGSLCLNTGGSSTSTRLFVNNGTTNWVAITTAS